MTFLNIMINELVTTAAKKKILNDSSLPSSVGEIVHQVELITEL
jgi:hypothetical protein